MSALLSPTDASQWLQAISPRLNEIARKFESVEPWCLSELTEEDRKILADLEELARQIDQSDAAIIFDDQNLMPLIRILAYLPCRSSLRMLSITGGSQPGLDGDLMRACMAQGCSGHPQEAECKVVRERVRQIVAVNCYLRVFGPDNRRETLEILRTMQPEEVL